MELTQVVESEDTMKANYKSFQHSQSITHHISSCSRHLTAVDSSTPSQIMLSSDSSNRFFGTACLTVTGGAAKTGTACLTVIGGAKWTGRGCIIRAGRVLGIWWGIAAKTGIDVLIVTGGASPPW